MARICQEYRKERKEEMQITKEQLLKIMPNAKYKVDVFLPLLNKYMEKFGINTKLRAAHFLAQIAHESNELRAYTENFNYSYEGLLRVFPKYFNATTAKAYARQPERIANKVYANRMGNGDEKSGDGFRYRGRGLIQLTGKSMYAKFNVDSPENVVEHPELMAQPDMGTYSACWFFSKVKNLNVLADKDDVLAITKAINGGTNGLAERKKYLARAKSAL